MLILKRVLRDFLVWEEGEKEGVYFNRTSRGVRSLEEPALEHLLCAQGLLPLPSTPFPARALQDASP